MTSRTVKACDILVASVHGGHEWVEEYYGYRCRKCKEFIPYGSEPWAPLDNEIRIIEKAP